MPVSEWFWKQAHPCRHKGLQTRDFLRIIIEQASVPVVVDAGIGAPSHATEAMEMGADACLVNTAIAVAGQPVEMAMAFKEAVIAGRRAYEAGLSAYMRLFGMYSHKPYVLIYREYKNRYWVYDKDL